MDGECRSHGNKVGTAVAKDCRKEISKLTRNQLANVCGNKMETLLREMSRFFTTKSEWNFYINRDEWKEGFFQGFMDRAELYVGKELA